MWEGWRVYMKGWHCVVCLCEWCGRDNHKVLLSNCHVCQSTANGCVGSEAGPVAVRSVSSLCHGRPTAKLRSHCVMSKVLETKHVCTWVQSWDDLQRLMAEVRAVCRKCWTCGINWGVSCLSLGEWTWFLLTFAEVAFWSRLPLWLPGGCRSLPLS